ncbi:hypothetical protein WOLCODRAFT_140211 [Wolfiporia cocos MD-104 SS10]|uniref:Zinc finger PHD-type domain-containing protein n=1 Tax=Wolfiporia cocos (strain MD-104) TaxID=742152 RepID=A0A2H3J8F8_WOLCO|nr:hypothetical protein WOLCODRAFT_140211 [Wolfiporia cocos MD-104 SS10]
MANVAVMGPPPSPKEPRRSRRTVPTASTSSKSPAGSPTSDTAPKAKENPSRPPLPSSSSSSKSKRSKQEDADDTLEDVRKNGANGNGNARSKRKGKEKEKASALAEATGDEHHDNATKSDAPDGDGGGELEDGEEEQGITRCICRDEEDSQGEFMAQCEMCSAWQHGQCMGFTDISELPNHYYCEQCRPDLYPDLLKKHAKRARQSSTNSHHTTTAANHASRASRSHSPTHFTKPTKRRNTMNSRDAMYEESLKAIMEESAAEAAAQGTPVSTPAANGTNADDGETEQEAENANKRKRKRSDDDAGTAKRTRSASIASDRTAANNLAGPRDATPLNGTVPVSKPAPAPATTAKSGSSRNRRAAARKTQAQDQVAAEGDEASNTASSRKSTNNRSKVNTGNDHGRRAQASTTTGQGANGSAHTNASRAYHNSHAYAVSQQPLFTSWNLPDYLAHLEPMLPTDVPRPLEVRGCGVDPSGRESLERTTERGVKVKWPSKRMSVGDMNKRVRALVEWVGREQASALERSRRREAIEKVLKDVQAASGNAAVRTEDPPRENADAAVGEGVPSAASPLPEKKPNPDISSESGPTTMKMMEELMEELISFQERFGPGAKTKERERRTAIS